MQVLRRALTAQFSPRPRRHQRQEHCALGAGHPQEPTAAAAALPGGAGRVVWDLPPAVLAGLGMQCSMQLGAEHGKPLTPSIF